MRLDCCVCGEGRRSDLPTGGSMGPYGKGDAVGGLPLIGGGGPRILLN